MKATFAFDEATSPVSRVSATKVKTYPEREYMALCQFTNTFWEFDRERNFAPRLVFEGEVERLDAIDDKFPHDIDAVYFGKEKPRIRYDYQFNDEQYAALGSKGFWSEDGVHIPELFSTAKFQLECKAVVKEISNAYETQNVPIFNVSISHPYDNTFNVDQYDIAEFITREQPDENKALENGRTYQDFIPEADIAAEVEAAKAALAVAQEKEKQAAYVPLSPEELDIFNKSANVSSYVDNIRDNIQAKRDADNAAVLAEQVRIKAEQEALANADKTSEKDANYVDFDDKPTEKKGEDLSKLAGIEETTKYENNDAIFNDAVEDEQSEIPDNIADFMKRLGAASAENDVAAGSDDKKDDKKDDNGSGTASGAQGLGVYTFEDQSTAQYEMRLDEGKGNEKPDDEKGDDKKDDTDDKRQDEKSDAPSAPSDTKSETDMAHRKTQLETSIRDTTVNVAERDKDDRSK